MKDKNGIELDYGYTVSVPEPKPNDMWQHAFSGSVHEFRPSTGTNPDLVTVIDGDGDCWDIEPERLIIE
jgi:hypothetical protein